MRPVSASLSRAHKRSQLIAIAALCLVTQAFTLAHFGIVRHVRCAEHGEMVELDADAGRVGGRTPEDLALTSMSSSLQAADGHHDHCAVAAEKRALRSDVVALVSAAPALARAAELPPLPVDAAGQPLYRLAPKISPPLVA